MAYNNGFIAGLLLVAYTALAFIRALRYYWAHRKESPYAATPLAFCTVFILVGMFESVYAPFSIIGCVYFLVQTCISSLRAQTLRDIELIFVCDGSPDHSLAILRRVEPLDSRIRVIAFEENQGVSAARNAGLDAARGDYIGFCDGDDWAEPQMYETLLRAAEEAGADVAFCRVFKDRGEAREDVPLGFDDGTVFSREEIGRTLIPAMLSRATDSDELPLSGYTPRNLFRREAIGSHRFRPDIRYAEDLLFIVACMKDARCAVAVDRAYYHYRFHSGSVTKHFSFHVPESYEKSNDALFWERVRRAKAYMNRPDIAALFDDVKPSDFPAQLGVKLFLMQRRMAFAMCFLFTYVFDRV